MLRKELKMDFLFLATIPVSLILSGLLAVKMSVFELHILA